MVNDVTLDKGGGEIPYKKSHVGITALSYWKELTAGAQASPYIK